VNRIAQADAYISHHKKNLKKIKKTLDSQPVAKYNTLQTNIPGWLMVSSK
jgi:hypothetical protein